VIAYCSLFDCPSDVRSQSTGFLKGHHMTAYPKKFWTTRLGRDSPSKLCCLASHYRRDSSASGYGRDAIKRQITTRGRG
jgi:hypothetical protein